MKCTVHTTNLIGGGWIFLVTHQFLLLSTHNALWALIQFVLGQCDGQFEQELLVNWLQIVEWHSFRIDYGIKDIVEWMEILLETEFVEQFTETKWWSKCTVLRKKIEKWNSKVGIVWKSIEMKKITTRHLLHSFRPLHVERATYIWPGR